MLGPLSAGQVCYGVGGAPGGPVSPMPGWLPAGDRSDDVWTRRVVFGVVEPGFLWGPGLGLCAGVRCQGVARLGCLLLPYSWGWARLRSRLVTPGAPGSLLPRGVVAGVVSLVHGGCPPASITQKRPNHGQVSVHGEPKFIEGQQPYVQ